MSTRQEWLTQAEEWEAKARIAYEDDNDLWGEHCEIKAQACRSAADHAPEIETTNEA